MTPFQGFLVEGRSGLCDLFGYGAVFHVERWEGILVERGINRALPGLGDDALSEIFGLGRKWVCSALGYALCSTWNVEGE